MVNVDVKTVLVWLLYIALIVMVLFIIVLIKNLVTTVKKTNMILEDAKIVSEITAEKANQVDGIVSDVSGAVSDIARAVHNERGLISAISNIVRTTGFVASKVRKDSDSDEEESSKKKKTDNRKRKHHKNKK
ncbi:MAG: hypothetical protein PUB87_00365 [Eubacteriaceae bacterium]|nr:hypothetical protein [Eubacteriaceae bacterium]